MEHGNQESEQLLQMFLDAYLVQRDWKQAATFLDEEIQWVSVSSSGYLSGKSAVVHQLRAEIAATPQAHKIDYRSIEVRTPVPGCTTLLYKLDISNLGRQDGIQFQLSMYLSVICILQADGWRLSSLQSSSISASSEESEYLPVVRSDVDFDDFERRIDSRSVDILGRNIPGGIVGSYLEKGYPLYYVNRRMLDYLGYTHKEFYTAFREDVSSCIHPVDRARVGNMVKDSLQEDQEFETQCRIQNKNGSYIWVNVIGKRAVLEDGRSVLLCVVRDISIEVKAKQQLVVVASEQEMQARRYDELFQSVLCGIVQYRLEENNMVGFYKANREAIRIFGYEPEEFWAKTDWTLDSITAEEDYCMVLSHLEALNNLGDKNSYEYRLRQKNGEECWIVGSAELIQSPEGEQLIQSVFLDVNSRKLAEQQSQRLSDQVTASYELLTLALEHTSTGEFYYYPQLRECKIPAKTARYYKCREHYQNMPNSYLEAHITEATAPAFKSMFEEIHRGARNASCEFKMKETGVWCRETLSTVRYTGDSTPSFVIGIVEDITRQKEMETVLRETRSRDSLTGLYNKETGIHMAQDYLARKSPQEVCGLMLLDMDDFEEINRVEGKVFADTILQEVADIIRAETGPEDIQIRLGGDEFMLFIKECDKARATLLGPRIAELVRTLLLQPEKDLRISVSIGMCVTAVVEDYCGLYRCAESTLKYVKENGKGRAACYLDTSNELGVYLTQLYTEEHRVNEIDQQSGQIEEDFISFTLELLGKAKNLDDAIFLLLARIGKSLRFDRVSILETNHEFLSYRFTHQWVRNRGHQQVGQDIYVTKEEFETAAKMYDEDGLCDYNINEGVSDFSSCLHAAIWNYGDYAGSMSFEVNEKNYPWTQEHRKLLKELVKLVPSFLMKAKADAVSQAKTDFLSRMSHEIRTPMNAISGMTSIAKTVLEDKEKTLDCLNKIESANFYLLNLINDVLDMSKIESGKLELNLEHVNLSRLGEGLEALLEPQASEKKIALCFENKCAGQADILADGLRLNQVLINIIGNAIKFTPSGGKVLVSLAPISFDDQGITIHFSVKDNGIGIESSAQNRIFNAFEQAGRNIATQHGGTGLGLSISSRLVQMMGGTLEVKSDRGAGAEFFFSLPFAFSAGIVSSQFREEEDLDFDFSGKRILLAEDNELNLEIARAILEMHGFLVECAQDGSQAVECYTNHNPYYYDGVLMDIRMPIMDGLEATRRIRTLGKADSRTLPIIALTANAFGEDTKKSIESGMDGHLSKPIQVSKLLQLMGERLQVRQPTLQEGSLPAISRMR